MGSEDMTYALIDTDAGLDDAVALLMAIKAHQNPSIPFRIVGITCVRGNVALDSVTVNVTKLLHVMEVTDVPLFRGAAAAILHPFVHPSPYRHHGEDGFGDVDESILPRPLAKIESENAVSAIIRLANEYAGKLTIVALGPLTNLGLAARADDRIHDKLKNIYIMGGSLEGGNINAHAEFNFFCDVESVHVTLTAYKCPITIAPLELGHKLAAVTRDWRVNFLGPQNTPESNLMNLLEKKNLDGAVKDPHLWKQYDSTIMAALLEPSVVKKTINHPCSVELGVETRGKFIIDRLSVDPSHITIITEMDVPLFERMLLWAFNSSKYYKN